MIALLAAMNLSAAKPMPSQCRPRVAYVTDNPHIEPKRMKVDGSSVAIVAVYFTAAIPGTPPFKRDELKGVIMTRVDNYPAELIDALPYAGAEFTIYLKHLSAGRHFVYIALVRGDYQVSHFSACVTIPGNSTISDFSTG